MNIGIANKFSCEHCGEEGILYLNNETRSWHCERCHFGNKLEIKIRGVNGKRIKNIDNKKIKHK